MHYACYALKSKSHNLSPVEMHRCWKYWPPLQGIHPWAHNPALYHLEVPPPFQNIFDFCILTWQFGGTVSILFRNFDSTLATWWLFNLTSSCCWSFLSFNSLFFASTEEVIQISGGTCANLHTIAVLKTGWVLKLQFINYCLDLIFLGNTCRLVGSVLSSFPWLVDHVWWHVI